MSFLPTRSSGHGDRFVRRDRLDRQAGGDEAEERQLDRAPAGSRRHHLDRAAAVPRALDEALFLQVRQVLVHRGERREAEAATDFLETRRVPVLGDELVQVVQNLALAFRERKHSSLLMRGTIRKRKAKVNTVKVLRVRIPFRIPRRRHTRVRRRRLRAEQRRSACRRGRISGQQQQTAAAAVCAAAGRPDRHCGRRVARLGWRSRYVGSFGDDDLGALSRESLAQEGVDTTAARTVAGATNQFAVILVDGRSGDRTVLWDRHPGLTMGAADVPEAAVTSGRMLIVDCHETAAASQAAKYARAAGIPTVIDVEKVRPGIADLLQQIDAIVAAQAFPTELTGYDEPGRALEAMAYEFGTPVVCVTLGADGSLARCNGREVRTPAFPVDCVDSTGAGDVFRGGVRRGLSDAARWRHRRCARLRERGGGAQLPGARGPGRHATARGSGAAARRAPPHVTFATGGGLTAQGQVASAEAHLMASSLAWTFTGPFQPAAARRDCAARRPHAAGRVVAA